MTEDFSKRSISSHRPYLIQRLEKPSKCLNPFSNDICVPKKLLKITRQLFSFDYMGSAEFEFGAIPRALKQVGDYAVSNQLMTGTIEFKEHGKTVYYICHKELKDFTVETIFQLSLNEGKVGLKESCRLKQVLEGRNIRTCGWFDLDNHYFFFTDKEMYENTLKVLGFKKVDK